MMSARPPTAPMGRPPPMTLPKVVRSGRTSYLRLRATRAEPEAGDDLVEHEERADTVALGPQTVEEPGRWCDDTHVRRDRLDEHRGHLLVELGHHVVGHHHRVGHGTVGHAGRAGQAERGHTTAAGGEQRVGGTVEVAVEDDDAIASGEPRARRTAVLVASVPEFISRTRSQLGTRSRIASASSSSPGVGAPYEVPSRGGGPDRCGDGRVGVAEDDGPVALHQIDVAGALHVGDVAPRRGRPGTACRRPP